MTTLQITGEVSKHVTESQVLAWLFGILGTLLLMVLTYVGNALGRNTKVLNSLENTLGVKSQKIDDMQLGCEKLHDRIETDFQKVDLEFQKVNAKQDYYERVQAHHNMRIFRTEEKLNLPTMPEPGAKT